MTSDRINYLRVECRVVRVSRDAVAIASGPITAWIPLSLLHTLDERALTRGERMTVLRIVDWKVQALGLPIQPHEA